MAWRDAGVVQQFLEDPSGIVGSQSLSNKLLDYGDTGNAGATVDQHATTPLKGVY